MSEGGIRLGVRRASRIRRFGVPHTAAVRKPIAVGSHYPADPVELATTIERLLDGVVVPAGDRLAQAYIVPHASVGVCGPTAATAYARLRQHRAGIERIILLGPSHMPEIEGCVVTGVRAFETPLGEAVVDQDVVAMLEADGHVRVDPALHGHEYALEVQLPFLQIALPGVPIVPMIVAATGISDVVLTISAILEHVEAEGGVGRSIIVASAELSGGAGDGRTLDSIFDLAPSRIGIRDVCGAYPLRGVLGWAAHHQLHVELLGADSGYVTCAFRDRLIESHDRSNRPDIPQR